MKIDPSELVSQQEAAKIRGVSIQSIHELIKRGRFNTVEISGKQYLFRKEVKAFVPGRRGRPRKDAAAKSSQASKAAKRSSASKTKSAKKKKSS